ncbi:hypothetical protein P7K49_032272 [Saguinus oedipus]|uniref:Uncharacterized protein n=1 Tax=Saguinus oedipus TaxID=9490 RepID=A0ABQ9TXT2_SAGOE|nr:hypothetical protein P7K49_032272 [Saguinus oedipus]
MTPLNKPFKAEYSWRLCDITGLDEKQLKLEKGSKLEHRNAQHIHPNTLLQCISKSSYAMCGSQYVSEQFLELEGFQWDEEGGTCEGVNFKPTHKLKRWTLLELVPFGTKNIPLPPGARIDRDKPCQIPLSRLEIPGYC